MAAGKGSNVQPRLGWLSLVVVLLALGARSDRNLTELDKQYPGCFFKDFEYRPLDAERLTNHSLAGCQRACGRKPTCVGFTYWPSDGHCQFAAPSAERVVTTTGTVSGLPSCNNFLDSPQCTTDLPHNGFPGFTPKESNAAWPLGRQPAKLECWPQDLFGSYGRCGSPLVLEATGAGWPGKCRGMSRVPGVVGTKACEQLCRSDPKCASWQVHNDAEESCFQGLGSDCYVDPDASPVAAGRLMHGQVRKLMDLEGWHIAGLSRAFLADHRFFATENDAVRACRRICYSSTDCQYWQYAPTFGCWVDAPTDYRPPAPLTLSWAYKDTPFALDCIAGEMVQHFCASTDVRAEDETPVACAKRGGKYETTSWVDETVATSPRFCQKACQRNPDCSFFTFLPRGLCRLSRSDSTLVAAGDSVIYGPRDCATAAAEAAPASDAQAVWVATAGGLQVVSIEAPPHERGSKVVYMVGTDFEISNLDYSLMDHRHRLVLRRRFAQILANILAIPAETVTDHAVDGQPGLVEVAAGEAPHSTRVLAWVPNEPPDSGNIDALKKRLLHSVCMSILQAMLQSDLHMVNPAVKGPLEVSAQGITKRQILADAGGTWENLWVFLLFAMLVACAFVGLAVPCLQDGQGQCSDFSDDEKVGFIGCSQRARSNGVLGYIRAQARAVARAGRGKPPHHRGEFIA